MITDDLENILNSANEAIQNESYYLATNLYQKALNIDPTNWEAQIYYSLSSNMNVLYPQCDTAINTVSKALSKAPSYIKTNEDVAEVISFFCSDFCSLATQFALHIFSLNTEEFDRIRASNTYYTRLSPIAFVNDYLYPRNLRLSEMLYKFGDIIEFQFINQIDMKPVGNVWTTANFLLDTCIHNAGFFKKLEYKSKISEYKQKIKKYI